ncbi:UNVERIFIED_CONTAM: hypothetical protein K2H54_022229 [Gekko kuhli]
MPFLSQEHQQQVAQAVERAKQVTMTELNAIIGGPIASWTLAVPQVLRSLAASASIQMLAGVLQTKHLSV